LFTEVDWRNELKADNVVLVVCPVVTRELDKRKLDPAYGIREQARKVIAKLSELGKANMQCQVKPGIDLLLFVREPDIEWRLEGLSPDIPDDRIIATILSERAVQVRIVLVTADLGLKLKAEAKGIPYHTLPDNLLLSLTRSPNEVENIKLKERLSWLENRLPKLSIRLLSDEGRQSYARFSFKRLPLMSSTEIEREIIEVKKKYPLLSPRTSPKVLLISFLGVSDLEVERYNKEVEEYINQMPAYLEKKWSYRELWSRTIELHFVLVNEGNSPAEDIDIFFYFPDGFRLHSKDDFPPGPKPPEKPSPPKSMLERFQDMTRIQVSDYLKSMPSPFFGRNMREGMPRGPFIKKTESYEVKYIVPKLKHGLEIALEPVYITFPSIDEAHSFHVNYSIIAANVPEKINDDVHIIIDIQSSQSI
jgi:hypothetical protein